MLVFILLILSAVLSLVSMIVLLLRKTEKVNLWLIILVVSLIVFFIIAELLKKAGI